MGNIQVSPETYLKLDYDNKKRFISYWHQINEIAQTGSSNILEIGIGNGFVSNYLLDHGFDIKTLDIDGKLDPDVVGSVLDLPFDENSFELVSCCEVLEHLPFDDVETALQQIYEVASKYVVISVPDRTLCYKLLVKLPVIKRKSFLISIPKLLSKKHIFDGQHYWELGKKGYSVSMFKNVIKKTGFSILKSYRLFEYDNHHMFVLEK